MRFDNLSQGPDPRACAMCGNPRLLLDGIGLCLACDKQNDEDQHTWTLAQESEPFDPELEYVSRGPRFTTR